MLCPMGEMMVVTRGGRMHVLLMAHAMRMERFMRARRLARTRMESARMERAHVVMFWACKAGLGLEAAVGRAVMEARIVNSTAASWITRNAVYLRFIGKEFAM